LFNNDFLTIPFLPVFLSFSSPVEVNPTRALVRQPTGGWA